MSNGCRTFSEGHVFDDGSGWCIFGCGCRDDGRMVKVARGEVQAGPEYTPLELQEFFEKVRAK